MVLMYNYYHRKQFPQLAFADPKRFILAALLAAADANADFLVYLKRGGGDAEAGASVTDRAVEDACGIAEALEANAGSPQTLAWPISKVAVLLVDPTGKKCLIEQSSVTKGVWSIFEKDITVDSIDMDFSASGVSNQVAVVSEAYMLQATAYSLVEAKTGMKQNSLRFVEEHLVYSLSKKETTAKLFVLQYDQIVNRNLTEMPIEVLISRMSGPIFIYDDEACLKTTSVVEYYHILPYKEVLLNLLHKEMNFDSSQSIPKEQPLRKGKSSLHFEKNETIKEQVANGMSNIRDTTNASDAKENKGKEEVGNSGTNNCITSKKRKSRKRKSEALKASPQKDNGSLSNHDAETSKLVSNAGNAEKSRAKSGGGEMDKNKSSGGSDNLQTSAHLDKNKIRKHSVSKNMVVDTIKVNALEVDPRVKDHASENQIVKDAEISRCFTNEQMYALMQSLQKMRDDDVRERCMLGHRSAQLDMDIQTILTEEKMTPRVISILEKYEESSSNMMKVDSSTRSQTMKIRRKRLTEAVLSRTKCQELDDICHENNWILPRYVVLPSLIDGLYRATVDLVCPDLKLHADGGMKTTPHEAQDSAATAMLHQLHTKAKEKLAELDSNTPDTIVA